MAIVEEETKENVKKKSTWMRLLYMIVFAVLFNIAELAIIVVVIIQFITKLFTGGVHQRLQEFGDSAAQYIGEIIRFMTFQSEDLPYPFGDWPKGKAQRRRRGRKKQAQPEQLEKPEEDTPPASSDSGTGGVGGTDTPPTGGGPASS